MRRYFIKTIPQLARMVIAPFSFIIIFLLAFFNLSFDHYLYSGYERTYSQIVIANCIDAFVSLIILVALYSFCLKLTKTWTSMDFVAGIIYFSSYQMIFILFTMTDGVMLLKYFIENSLSYLGVYSFSDNLSMEAIGKQKDLRDIWITVIFFVVNTFISSMIVRLALWTFNRKSTAD